MRLRRAREGSGGTIDDFGMRSACHQRVVLGRLGRFPGLGRAGALLAGEIGLGEALFAGLGLPVVVSHSSAVHDDSASELSEHGPGRDNCDLPGTVRKRENLLLNEVVLLGLGGNDLEERPVLVEEQVRVSVAQNPGALGGEHEELVASVGYQKGSAPVLSTSLQRAIGNYLLLAKLVDLAGEVLIARRIQLIGRVVAHGRESFERRLGRRRLRRSCRLGGSRVGGI